MTPQYILERNQAEAKAVELILDDNFAGAARLVTDPGRFGVVWRMAMRRIELDAAMYEDHAI